MNLLSIEDVNDEEYANNDEDMNNNEDDVI